MNKKNERYTIHRQDPETGYWKTIRTIYPGAVSPHEHKEVGWWPFKRGIFVYDEKAFRKFAVQEVRKLYNNNKELSTYLLQSWGNWGAKII